MTLAIRAEQAPNPDSRVLLDMDHFDATGMPRIKLDWRLTGQDVDSVRGLVDALGKAMIARDVGRVEMADWLQDPTTGWVTDANVSAHPLGGYHHMGTTRMHDDPRHGVVDRECRVHGMRNLYMAGSSVFTTAGSATPTLMIVALALRLAAHLQDSGM